MLFSKEEIEVMKKEAESHTPKQDTNGFYYDSDVAKGEVYVLWSGKKSGILFENNHGCWDALPTIN